jgi:hypothetical protein
MGMLKLENLLTIFNISYSAPMKIHANTSEKWQN